ncbi:MAG: M50 family metallopeptidase [Candidatus Pacebacteria bacterium]|nr:M50 family metallopeptidase [Candidatus Paceibacterota bacterium]
MFLIIIAFISLLGLVVLHEFGHFIAAKRFGVKVDEFGIGFPPRLFGKKIGDTVYSLNLLPLGAFVKMPGEVEHTEDPDSFFKKAIWKRIVIVLAGVISFWLISFIIFSAIPTGVAISYVKDNTPAALASLKAGDVINSASVLGDEKNIFKISDVQNIINDNKGKEIVLNIQRGGENLNISVTPRASPPPEEGPLGISLAYGPSQRNYPLYQAPFKGFLRTAEFTFDIVTGWAGAISKAIKRQPTGVELTGPVGTFSLFSAALKEGPQFFLLFFALISLYIAMFNVLPIPSLDGGKLLFLIIEAVRKRPVSQKVEQVLTTAFFSLLILLMIFVTIKDVIRLF